MSFPIVVIILIVVIAGVFLYLRQKGDQPKARPAAPERRLSSVEKRAQSNTAELNKISHSDQYWGVSIHPDQASNCCEAAQALSGEQFTLDDVPNLPLTACDKPICLCRYVGLKERRTANRRQGHDRREEIRFDPNSSDRRTGKDRRKASQDIWQRHDTDA